MAEKHLIALPDGKSERDVLIEAIRIVVGRIRATQLMMGLLPFVFAWFFWDHAPRIQWWLGFHMILKLCELAELRMAVNDARIVANPHAVANHLMVSQTIHAFAWGMLLWAISPAEAYDYVAVIASLTAIGSGSATAFAPVLRVATGHILATSGTIIAVLLAQGGSMAAIIPSLMVVYAIAFWSRALQDSREARRGILLEFSNTAFRSELEKEVQRSRELGKQAEAANLAKSRFLAAASHDLRQPIHALGLFLGAMDADAKSESQRATLDNAQAAARASAEMLDALLDFSRAEAGVIVAKPQSFPIQDLLSDLEAALAPLAESKGLLYRTRDSRAWTYSDPALVRMILHNLVANAVRYTSEGGILVGCRQRGGKLIVEVWDTGIGIDAAQFDAIFDDFQQLGNPERDRRKGLGLGLAISRRLAKLLESPLLVSSHVGKGSVFRLTLPLVNPAEASDLSQSAGIAAPCHVLIVDDDSAIRLAMAQLLENWGYSCATAETGDEALALAREQAPELLLCDWRLRNGEQGTDVINRLRTQTGEDVPAVLVTGDTSPERLQEAARLSLPVLHKPVLPSNLRTALAHVGKDFARSA